jgi:hypothetical protein
MIFVSEGKVCRVAQLPNAEGCEKCLVGRTSEVVIK